MKGIIFMKKIKGLIKKFCTKEVILYGIFGLLTTMKKTTVAQDTAILAVHIVMVKWTKKKF